MEFPPTRLEITTRPGTNHDGKAFDFRSGSRPLLGTRCYFRKPRDRLDMPFHRAEKCARSPAAPTACQLTHLVDAGDCGECRPAGRSARNLSVARSRQLYRLVRIHPDDRRPCRGQNRGARRLRAHRHQLPADRGRIGPAVCHLSADRFVRCFCHPVAVKG